MIITLINNIAIIISLALIYEVLFRKFATRTFLSQIIYGLSLGLSAIVAMNIPWVYEPGFIFDSRSIVLSIGALFFGTIPALISAVLAALFRFYIGGIGTITGITVILMSTSMGIGFRHFMNRKPENIPNLNFYLFSILVHILMLSAMLLTPWDSSIPLLKKISIPVMILYPFGGLLLGVMSKRSILRTKFENDLTKFKSIMSKSEDLGQIGSWEYKFIDKNINYTDQIYKIFGIDEVSKNDFDIFLSKVHPEDSEFVKKAWDEGYDGKNYDIEYRIIVNDKLKWIREKAEVSFDSNNKPLSSVGFTQDITSRKLLLVNAIKREESLQKMLQSFPLPVSYSDHDGNIKFVNNSFIDTFGYTLEMIDNVNLWYEKAYPNPEYRAEVIEKWNKTILGLNNNQSESKNDEYMVTCLDGSVKNVLITGVVVEDRLLVILNDITESKMAADNLKMALDQAKNAVKVKDLFLANMTHEIRTPLNSIIGFSHVIKDEVKGKVSEEYKSYFDIIINSGQRLMDTVTDILDLSLIQAGTTAYTNVELDLVKLLNDSTLEFQHMAKTRKIGLNFNTDLNSAIILADISSMYKAITNLIENAIKYTKSGEIRVTLTLQDSTYVIEIQDSGMGMTKDFIDIMWTPFTQESTGYKRKYQGLGLGLAITKQCLDLNNIHVDVNSTKDKGTTFTLIAKKPEEKEIQSLHKKIKSKFQTIATPHLEKNILYVEDDELSIKLVEVQLAGYYNIIPARTVKESIAELEENKIHLVLLDLSLSGKRDGIDLAHYIRNKDDIKNIPIVVLTAHTFDADRKNAKDANCNAFLTKPVERIQLLDTIHGFLDTEKN